MVKRAEPRLTNEVSMAELSVSLQGQGSGVHWLYYLVDVKVNTMDRTSKR